MRRILQEYNLSKIVCEMGCEMTDAAVDRVMTFIEEINEWGHVMNIVSRIDDGRVINHAADRALIPDESYDEYLKKFYVIFDRHWTNRERKYGRSPNWDRNGSYYGMSRDTIESVKFVNPSRIEVVVSGCPLFDEIMFVVFLRKGEWLIDSAKCKIDGEKWETFYI